MKTKLLPITIRTMPEPELERALADSNIHPDSKQKAAHEIARRGNQNMKPKEEHTANIAAFLEKEHEKHMARRKASAAGALQGLLGENFRAVLPEEN